MSETNPGKTPAHRHRYRLAILLACVVIFAIASRHFEKKSAPGIAAPRPIPIRTERARLGDIPRIIQALGTVYPENTINVFSRVQGEIMKVDFTEGQLVKKGDSLIDIDPRPYQAALLQAEGELTRDNALLQEARIDLTRYRKAWRKNAIQKQLLDDQEQIVLQNEGTVRADEGVLEGARANLAYCFITSPIAGRAGLRLVDPGNIVQANSTTSLVVVTQLEPITVIFNVAEDYLPTIQERLKQSPDPMLVEAYDRENTRRIASGKFLALDNQVDTTTGTVRIRATFDNKDETLFPNQFVNARLILREEQGATLLSTTAVQHGAQGTYVYVIDAAGTAHMRPVKVGVVSGELSAVEGVKPDEQVTISGFDKLQEGTKVSIRNDHELAGTAPGATP